MLVKTYNLSWLTKALIWILRWFVLLKLQKWSLIISWLSYAISLVGSTNPLYWVKIYHILLLDKCLFWVNKSIWNDHFLAEPTSFVIFCPKLTEICHFERTGNRNVNGKFDSTTTFLGLCSEITVYCVQNNCTSFQKIM